jgi:acyl-coenzyme A thioesterase PaaI-like protein
MNFNSWAAVGYAALSYLPAGSDVLTVELKINYLTPTVGQSPRAVGMVIRPGRRITVVSTEVFTTDCDNQTNVAMLQGTMLPLEK